MVNKTTHLPTVRLALAGYASLALLAWIGFVPSGFPAIFRRYGAERPVPILVSAAISLLVLVCLVPVLWRGPRRDRWLAVLLLVFPTFIFGITALWLVG